MTNETVTTDEARQGITGTGLRYMLVVSVVGAIIGLVIVAFVFL